MATKRIASTLIYFILSLGASLSWGADSTAPPFSSGLKPNVSSNQPFLLDSGYADVSNMKPNPPCTNANADGSIPAGSVWENTPSIPTEGAPLAIRTIVCSNSHLCPSNFTPVVIVSPYKSLGQGNESMRACVDALVTNNNERYWFGVWVNSTADLSGNAVPATSYYWSIYCYPISTYGTTYNPSSISGTSASLCGPTTNTFAPAILLWDSGFVDWPQDVPRLNTSIPGLYNLPTNRICPANYTPYIQMRSNFEWGGDNGRLLIGHGICLFDMTHDQSPTYYTVYYMINSRYVNLQVSVSGNDSDKYYVWRNSAGSPKPGGYRDPYPIVNSAVISGVQSAPTDAGRIEWTLYCYPPGYSPPQYLNDANCQAGSAPF